MINLIKESGLDQDQKVNNEWRAKVKGVVDGKLLKKAMAFGNSVCDDVKERGLECLNEESPLDEFALLQGAKE